MLNNTVEILMDLVDLNWKLCCSTIYNRSRDPYGSRGSKFLLSYPLHL